MMKPFDPADYLDNEETIAEYLAVAKEDPDPEIYAQALEDVERARKRRQGGAAIPGHDSRA